MNYAQNKLHRSPERKREPYSDNAQTPAWVQMNGPSLPRGGFGRLRRECGNEMQQDQQDKNVEPHDRTRSSAKARQKTQANKDAEGQHRPFPDSRKQGARRPRRQE